MWFVFNRILSLFISEVTKRERDLARRIYDHNEEKVREKVAFGRRSQGPPSLYYPSSPRRPATRASGECWSALSLLSKHPSQTCHQSVR